MVIRGSVKLTVNTRVGTTLNLSEPGSHLVNTQRRLVLCHVLIAFNRWGSGSPELAGDCSGKLRPTDCGMNAAPVARRLGLTDRPLSSWFTTQPEPSECHRHRICVHGVYQIALRMCEK